MSDLERHLNDLVKWMREACDMPSYAKVMFVEDKDIFDEDYIDADKCWYPFHKIPRNSLKSLQEYAPIFDRHLDAGHLWINMNAAGILDDTLLIKLGFPTYKNTVPREHMSVNFSGPYVSQGWDASSRYKIID